MRGFLLLALAMVSGAAHAGTRAVYDERAEGRQLVFEIADNGDFRAGDPEGGGYRLVIGDEAYQVEEVDGEMHVARLADIEQALKAATSGFARGAMKALTFLAASEPQEVRPVGRRRVGAWRGRAYRVAPLDWDRRVEEDGFAAEDDASYYVLSDDPDLAPVGEAMTRYTADSAAFSRHLVSGAAADSLLGVLDELAGLGTIVAASEGDVRLARVEDAETAPARLVLPAEPMTVDEIAALIRAKRNPFKQVR